MLTWDDKNFSATAPSCGIFGHHFRTMLLLDMNMGPRFPPLCGLYKRMNQLNFCFKLLELPDQVFGSNRSDAEFGQFRDI